MERNAWVLAVSGAFFGLIVGWILGSQGSTGFQAPAPVESAQPAPATGSQPATRVVDQARVTSLEEAAALDPNDPAPRILLGDMYFDAEQYPDAIRWYEAAFALDPSNPNVSTDLGVSYYYTDDPDRALAQFERSLQAAPGHVKTLLNTGIVRAFGKQDPAGAVEAWQQVVDLAPDSPEGRAARQAIDAMRGAHPEFGADSPPGGE